MCQTRFGLQESRLKAQDAMREDEGKWIEQERKLMERRVKHQVQVIAYLIIIDYYLIDFENMLYLICYYNNALSATACFPAQKVEGCESSQRCIQSVFA